MEIGEKMSVVTPKSVLSQASERELQGVVVISAEVGGSVNIQWSSIPFEALCYYAKLLNMAVEDAIKKAASQTLTKPTIVK